LQVLGPSQTTQSQVLSTTTDHSAESVGSTTDYASESAGSHGRSFSDNCCVQTDLSADSPLATV